MRRKHHLLKVRGVLRHHDSILFCYNKANQFYFLPGGSLETHENLPQCLERELLEECQLPVSVGRFLGCLECYWQEGQEQHQEINFIFQLQVQQIPSTVESLEEHISFAFLKETDIKAGKHRLLPQSLVQFLEEAAALQYLCDEQHG